MAQDVLKLGLLGYGKMGKAIDRLAETQQCAVEWRIGREQSRALGPEFLRSADVVIEFSRPEAALHNVRLCLEAGVPVVCGTTGWQQELESMRDLCRQTQGAFLWASNFSIGVNLFFALNRYLANLLQNRPEYQPLLKEIHHIHKLDAPSGTAVTLAEGILTQRPEWTQWGLASAEALPPGTLPITAERTGKVPGTHHVRWDSPIDTLEIIHTAHTRDGFALGALLAARWLHSKKGAFGMEDVLSLHHLTTI